MRVDSRQSTVDSPEPSGRPVSAVFPSFLLTADRGLSTFSPCYPACVNKPRRLAAFALAAVAVLGATALLPTRVAQVAREVEKVRGRRFERAVPASEIDG